MQSLRRKLKGDARGLSNALPPSRSASRVGCSIEPEKRRFRGGTPDTAGSQKLGPFRRGAYRGLGDPVAYGKGMPVFFFSASKGKEPPGPSFAEFFGLAKVDIPPAAKGSTLKEKTGHGGKRAGAGRPTGAKNKLWFELPEQRVLYEGVETPLAYLLQVMRDPRADWRRRDKAARAAAPYCHSKPAAPKAAAN